MTGKEDITSKGKTSLKGCMIVLILVVIFGLGSCVAMLPIGSGSFATPTADNLKYTYNVSRNFER